MLDYALVIMIGVVILNLSGDGFLVAGAYLVISLFIGYLLDHAANVEVYAIYAAGELLFIHCIHSIAVRTPLISDMISISRLSIFFQLVGVVLWIEYYDSSTYMALCEIIFIMQVLRMTVYGFATRKGSNPWSNTVDYLHTNYRGEKL